MDRAKRVSFTCDDCGSVYSYKNSLVKHIKRNHLAAATSGNGTRNKKKKNEKRIICAIDCGQKFTFLHQYFHHLDDFHDIKVENEKITFQDDEEFESWKKRMEDETSSQYVKDFQAKKQKNGDYVSWYHCHRSFNFRLHRKSGVPVISKDSRIKKQLGTNKLNFTCPSYFKLIRKKDRLIIEFYKTHLGHDCEVVRMRLHPDTRCSIAGKLSLGVPISRVLADIRNEKSLDDLEKQKSLTRLELTTRKDVYNIAASFNINNPIQTHSDDGESVELFINKLQKQGENNPILLFKKQGQSSDTGLRDDDFVIVFATKFQRRMLQKFGPKAICIDGTHGTNAYKFLLYTIIVLDEWDEGIPVAFAISNREDEEFFKIFFETIKIAVGKISTKVFMSDDASAFYNAWVRVMDTPKQKLLCLWHVHKNWTINQSKIKNEKQKAVIQTLSSIAEELDESSFIKEFNNFIIRCEKDPDTKEFAAYIRRAYYNNMRSWARCFRKHVPIQTNMNLEAFHKTLKYDYLGGVTCTRIDKLIYALLSIVRDKRYQREIKTLKKTPYKNIQRIVKSHLDSAEIEDIRVEGEKNTWIVKNKYLVQRLEDVISICCRRVCETCKICVHMFICSCRNNAVDYNICKHIHACAAKFFTPSLASTQNDQVMIEEIVVVPSEIEVEDVPVPSTCLRRDSDLDEEILLKNELIQGFVNTQSIPVDRKEELIRLQDRIIGLYRTYAEVNPAPPKPKNCGKIVKQTFYPTRKTTVKQKPKLPQVSAAGKEAIQTIFKTQDVNKDLIIIHDEFDHMYE